jgi:hypothetical protein
MENIALEKFNGFNFHTWKVKIQLQMMHKNLWGIVKGTEKAPTDPKQLIEWEKREDRAKSILGLSLADSQLHLIDLEKSSEEMWVQLCTIFGEKAVNAKFSLKLQLFKLKMHDEVSLSSHINDLKSLLAQLADIDSDSKVGEDDAKAILLNSLSKKYDNAIFTLTQMPSRTLEDMISALLAEEKRMKEGDLEVSSNSEIALYSKGRTNKNIECFYCRRHGHTTLNCKTRASDLLNGKLKESANIADDSLGAIQEHSSSDDEPSQSSLRLF